MAADIHNGDSLFATISLCAILLGAIGIGTIASVVGIAAGIISIIINYPKFKERIKNLWGKRQ